MAYSSSSSQLSVNGQNSSIDSSPGNRYSHLPDKFTGNESSSSVELFSNNYSYPPNQLLANGHHGTKTNTNTTVTYLEIPRVFYPSSLCVPRPPTPQSLTTYNAVTNITNPLFNPHDKPSTQLYADTQTIVVSCSVLQTASLGIFFGQGSKHNFSLLLDSTFPHSSSKIAAETFAIHKSLKLARNIANVFGPDRITIMKIVVVTSCAPVVRVMTQWIADWNQNDWSSADRYFEGATENRSALERLDRLVDEIVDGDGLEVEFWLVGSEGVIEAEELARKKLEGVDSGHQTFL